MPGTSLPAGGSPSAAAASRLRLELAALSFASLYLELALVRWLSSYVVFLGFFANLVLVASFVGLSLGVLAAARRASYLHVAPYALALLLVLGAGFYFAYLDLPVAVRVVDPRDPSMVYFGAEARAADASFSVFPIELLAAVCFALVLAVFLGIGQELGRRFERAERPLDAYLVNLAASVLGVLAFALVSWLRLSPWAWLLPPVLLLLPFLPGGRWLRLQHAVVWLGAAGLAGAVGLGLGFAHAQVRWSPYYHIHFDPRSLAIRVNGLTHQVMSAAGGGDPVYRLPWAMLEAAGHPTRRALVIGAGSGNDVAAARAAGVAQVDAAEIDPTILELGRHHHPARPYDDPAVHVALGDGRAFLRRPGPAYDTVVYALVDSLAAHSAYSSIRLESYLMTREALGDVKRRLAPGGVFVMYNSFRQGFVVSRLATLLEEVFGSPPLVLSFPPRDRVGDGDVEKGMSILVAGDVEGLRRRFAAGSLCLAALAPGAASPLFADASCPEDKRLWPSRFARAPRALLPDDDWPFLYLRALRIPGHVLVMNGAVLLVSLVLLAWLRPPGSGRLPDAHFLLLGAGFMLLETRSVVQMALVYGATWLTTAVVVLAILVTSTLATVAVRASGLVRTGPAYVLLLAGLGLNVLVPATSLLGLAEPLRTLAVAALVGLPVFFAGVVFGVSFAGSRTPARDFGSNVAGVVVGAVAENLSLLTGFRGLLLVALGFYALSAAALWYRGTLVPKPAAPGGDQGAGGASRRHSSRPSFANTRR